jgi:hypothetical protein
LRIEERASQNLLVPQKCAKVAKDIALFNVGKSRPIRAATEARIEPVPAGEFLAADHPKCM